MKVETISSNQPASHIPNVTASRRAVEISKIAAKIILGLGISMTAACFIGIWALPLDLIIYSGAIKVLAIPASLLALPPVLTIWAMAHAISKKLFKSACKTYHSALLAKLLEANEVSNELIAHYREASLDVKKLDLTVAKCNIAKEKLNLILEASPKIKKIKLDAKYTPQNTLSKISDTLSDIKKLTVYHPNQVEEWASYDRDPYTIIRSNTDVKIIKRLRFFDNGDTYDNSSYDYSYNDAYTSNSNDISFAFEWR